MSLDEELGIINADGFVMIRERALVPEDERNIGTPTGMAAEKPRAQRPQSKIHPSKVPETTLRVPRCDYSTTGREAANDQISSAAMATPYTLASGRSDTSHSSNNIPKSAAKHVSAEPAIQVISQNGTA